MLQISKNSPADVAGIEPWDIIIQFDDTSTVSMEALKNAIGKSSVGEKHTLKVVRGSKLLSISLESSA